MSAVLEEMFAVIGYKVDAASAKRAEKQLEKTNKQVESISKTLGSLFIGGALVTGFKGLIDQADHLEDSAQSLNVTTDALQSMGYAANQSGSDMETVSKAMTLLQKQSYAAAHGSKEVAASFKSIGISAKDLKAMTPDEMLERVADAIADTTSPVKKTAIAMKLFGESGAKLLPFLNQGADGIRELRDEFKELGLGFSKEFIENSAKLNDELAKTKFSFQGLVSSVGASLLPVLNKTIGLVTSTLNVFIKLTKGTEIMRGFILAGAAALLAFGAAWLWTHKQMVGRLALLAAFATAIDDISNALKGGQSLIGTWMDKWGGIGTVDSYVRSLGQGLKIINEALSKGTFFKTLMEDSKEFFMGDSRRRERREARYKAALAEKDPAKRAAGIEQYRRELVAEITRSDHQLNETPRAMGQGVDAAQEIIQEGTASASAVNEGIYNAVTRENGIASTNDKGQTIYRTTTNNNNVTINTKTDASAEQIGREVKKQLDNRDEADEQQVGAQLRRRR